MILGLLVNCVRWCFAVGMFCVVFVLEVWVLRVVVFTRVVQFDFRGV